MALVPRQGKDIGKDRITIDLGKPNSWSGQINDAGLNVHCRNAQFE